MALLSFVFVAGNLGLARLVVQEEKCGDHRRIRVMLWLLPRWGVDNHSGVPTAAPRSTSAFYCQEILVQHNSTACPRLRWRLPRSRRN